MNRTVLEVHDKQADFLEAEERKVLLYGGRGPGKTYALCLLLASRAAKAGAREGLFRKHGKHLKATTLKTLLEGDGETGPVLPRGTYSHNKTEGCIRIHNGGEIVYRGLDDPLTAGSYNLTGLAVDELIELSETDWRMLQGCVRVVVEGLPNRLYAAFNPSVPSHWVAKEFGLALGHKPQPGCRAIFTSPYDSPWLPPDFIKELEGLPGIARKRFLEGKWVGSDGLVYDRWDRAVHVRADGRGVRRVVLAVDEGYTNPFAALRVEIDGDGRLYVSGEFYRRQQNVSQKVAAVRAMGECEAVVVDPSAADLIRELRDAGLPVVPALNEVFDGIMKVQQRLTLAGDGYPRLTVDPGCDNLIREFETYEWKANRQSGATKDEPIKEHDHALDALRYAVAYLDRGLASVATGTPVAAPVRPPGPRGIQELIERPIRPEPWGSPRRELARAPRTRYT